MNIIDKNCQLVSTSTANHNDYD